MISSILEACPIPGYILGDMPRLRASNIAKTKLAQACSAQSTSIIVESSAGFPPPPFRIFVGTSTNYEIMEVTAVSGNTWTVLRGRENTTPASFPAGTAVENRFTAGSHEELVSGPSSATAGNMAVFADSSGKILADGGPPLQLGETANTAFRGDLGKIAYDHAQATTGKVHGATDVGIALFRLPNPSAVRFIRINADNTVTARAASDFLTDIGAMPITGGTFQGKVYAQRNTDYSVGQIRNIFISTNDPSGGGNGDIWIKYVP